MLAQETVKEYGERARFAVQDFGASPLAERFGIDKYPAIIVDDALVARPEDFYAWGGAGKGRYIPWSELENRREFQRDLSRMIDIRLAGGDVHAAAGDRPAGGAMLPSLTLTDLAGRTIRTADLRGKPVFVEFWAPWCPPCLETMRWLKTIDTSRVNVVLIAVESERAQVEKLVAEVQPPGRVVIGSAETIEAFGGLPAIPAMFVAAPDGRITRTFLGAPPRLHEEITAALQAAASRPEKRQS